MLPVIRDGICAPYGPTRADIYKLDIVKGHQKNDKRRVM